MGGVFHLPVFDDLSWPSVYRWALESDYSVIAADLGKGTDFTGFNWPRRTLLCIGGEASGLISVPEGDIQEHVFIPLAKGAESLNAGVAAGILLYAARP
jgi:TrmH family RNA methyltransferase